MTRLFSLTLACVGIVASLRADQVITSLDQIPNPVRITFPVGYPDCDGCTEGGIGSVDEGNGIVVSRTSGTSAGIFVDPATNTVGAGPNETSFRIAFNQPMYNAVGFYVASGGNPPDDFGDYIVNFSSTTGDGGEFFPVYDDPSVNPFDPQKGFFVGGIVNGLVSSIDVYGGNIGLVLSDLTVGSNELAETPEPTSLSLLLGGLVATGLAVNRSKQKVWLAHGPAQAISRVTAPATRNAATPTSNDAITS